MEVSAHEGIPLRAIEAAELAPGHQHLIETGISFEFLEVTIGKIYSIPDASRIKPLVAPGFITKEVVSVSLLCANINKQPIRIKRGQIIGFLQLRGYEDFKDIRNFGSLGDLGLPDKQSAHTVIDVEGFKNLIKDQKKQAKVLFDKYEDIFATHDYDISLA